MSEKPWTPGPWRWRFAGSAGQWRLRGANNEHVVSGGSPNLVPDDEPDMALQAAAPELVEALENCIGAMESAAGDLYSAGVEVTAGSTEDQVDECRALLAKLYGDTK